MLKNTVVMVWVVIVIGTNSVTNVLGASISENEETIETREVPSELGSGETLQIVRSALEDIYDREGSGTSLDEVHAIDRQFDRELAKVAVQPVLVNGGDASEEVRQAVPQLDEDSLDVEVQPVPQISDNPAEV